MEHLETFSWIDFIAHGLGVHIPPQLEHVLMTWVVMVLLIVPSFLLTRRLKGTPGAGQNLLEFLVEMLQDFLESMMGPKGKRYLPLIGTLTLFILFSNLLGLVPGFHSPTNNLNTTVACALVVFFSTHIIGIKEQGLRRYLRHFTGPVWWLAPIMVPVEVIGHLARPVSLSVRLFGNIFGEDAVLVILLSLVPLLIPLPMMFLAVFTSVVQTFVFVMLSTLYIAGAQETDHSEGTISSPERKE
ncbi:MAG: F0F1 ATP synthase subunit A [candidate division NC10 bacterium]|nr:F0F1 ATP synthase subunit A [candidate division NC10 bacterium]